MTEPKEFDVSDSTRTRRLKACVENWPGCVDGDYNPACCRFPKSCSCEGYDPETISEDRLEPAPPTTPLRGPGAQTKQRTLYEFNRDRLREEELAGGDPQWIEVHRLMNRYGGLAVVSSDEAPEDGTPESEYIHGAATAWEVALQMLAGRWKDHPDYREDWDEED